MGQTPPPPPPKKNNTTHTGLVQSILHMKCKTADFPESNPGHLILCSDNYVIIVKAHSSGTLCGSFKGAKMKCN